MSILVDLLFKEFTPKPKSISVIEVIMLLGVTAAVTVFLYGFLPAPGKGAQPRWKCFR